MSGKSRQIDRGREIINYEWKKRNEDFIVLGAEKRERNEIQAICYSISFDHQVLRFFPSCSELVLDLCDPWLHVRRASVDAWVVGLAAPDAPRHDTDLHPSGAVTDHHGAAGVALGRRDFFHSQVLQMILTFFNAYTAGKKRCCICINVLLSAFECMSSPIKFHN